MAKYLDNVPARLPGARAHDFHPLDPQLGIRAISCKQSISKRCMDYVSVFTYSWKGKMLFANWSVNFLTIDGRLS